MRAIKIYTAYFAQFLKARMAYKTDFFSSIVANFIITGTGILYIIFLVDGETITSLKGWSREEVVFIYAYSMLSMSFFYIFAPNLYKFGDRYIIQGEFDRVLLRPLNSLSQVIFESFNIDTIGSFILAICLVGYSADYLGLEFNFFDYFWFVVSGISGGVIILCTFVVIASLSFHFEDRVGIAPPLFSLLRFARYPLTIYNHFIQFLLSWILPFGFVAFYPATHFLGREEFAVFCYATPFIAVLMFVIAMIFWNFGVANYKSTGN